MIPVLTGNNSLPFCKTTHRAAACKRDRGLMRLNSGCLEAVRQDEFLK